MRNVAKIGIVIGVILFCYGGLTIMNHGAPRPPLPLSAL
jgi:hypothetical protein